FPSGSGIDDTMLRSAIPGGDANTPRLFQLPNAPHPYLQDELLTKIYNQLTTRSNVFAVWITVGFFEVTDDTARPVKLGAEIGKAENRNVRHRLFAIVDRTNLAIPSRLTTLRPAVSPFGPGLGLIVPVDELERTIVQGPPNF